MAAKVEMTTKPSQPGSVDDDRCAAAHVGGRADAVVTRHGRKSATPKPSPSAHVSVSPPLRGRASKS